MDRIHDKSFDDHEDDLEDSDIEWDDVQEEEHIDVEWAAQPVVERDEQAELQAIDWQEIETFVNQQASASASGSTMSPPESHKNPHRRQKRLTKEEKRQLREQHQLHLLALLSRSRQLNDLANDLELQACVLSCFPIDQHQDLDNVWHLTRILQVLEWCHGQIRVTMRSSSTGGGHELLERRHLLQLIRTPSNSSASSSSSGKTISTASPYQFMCVFIALCRSLRLQVRLCCALDPRRIKFASGQQHQVVQYLDVIEEEDVLGTTARESMSDHEPAHKRQKIMMPMSKKTIEQAKHIWIEIYCADMSNNESKSKTKSNASLMKWHVVDVLTQHILKSPLEIERSRGGRVVPYVVSLDEESHVVRDITPRYATSWQRTQTFRLPRVAIQWWHNLMTEPVISSAREFHEVPPETLQALRDHPAFCLERDLSKYEMLYPKLLAGVCKGLPYYHRVHQGESCIQLCHTALKWKQRGYQIQVGQRASPAKTITVTGQEDHPRELFGRWQMEPYVPPQVDELTGALPENEYGNVEIWTEAGVPRNTVHLTLPKVKSIVTKLGLPFVKVMTGWTASSQDPSRSQPVFRGILIHARHESLVRSAYAELVHHQLGTLSPHIFIYSHISRYSHIFTYSYSFI